MSRAGVCLLAILASAGLLTACGGGESTTTSTGANGGQAPPAEPPDPPAQGFHDSSGVTEIPAFGAEASTAERLAAGQALAVYLAAARSGDWGGACSSLAAITRLQLRELLRRAKQIDDKSCGTALRLLLEAPSGEAPYYGPSRVAALRVKRGGAAGEGAGFALFHGDDGKDYWIAMRREDGEWKVTAMTARPLD